MRGSRPTDTWPLKCGKDGRLQGGVKKELELSGYRGGGLFGWPGRALLFGRWLAIVCPTHTCHTVHPCHDPHFRHLCRSAPAPHFRTHLDGTRGACRAPALQPADKRMADEEGNARGQADGLVWYTCSHTVCMRWGRGLQRCCTLHAAAAAATAAAAAAIYMGAVPPQLQQQGMHQRCWASAVTHAGAPTADGDATYVAAVLQLLEALVQVHEGGTGDRARGQLGNDHGLISSTSSCSTNSGLGRGGVGLEAHGRQRATRQQRAACAEESRQLRQTSVPMGELESHACILDSLP